jgi:hypothetical protein
VSARRAFDAGTSATYPCVWLLILENIDVIPCDLDRIAIVFDIAQLDTSIVDTDQSVQGILVALLRKEETWNQRAQSVRALAVVIERQ